MFEDLARLRTLRLGDNPGSASFVPRADAGEDLVLRTGETATLGGPGTGGGPWGTNVDYAWVEVDAEGSPVAPADRTAGLSAADAARPVFTAPALAAERVLRYRLTVTGKGAATRGTVNRFTVSDTVTLTVRAAPAVTAVALTSVPQDRAFREYQRGERIEVSVTFSAPVTVAGPPAMTPTIGLEVGAVVSLLDGGVLLPLVDPSRKSGGALHRLHCFCLEFDGACEVQRRVPTDWIIEPIDVSGYGSFSLAS